MSRVAGRILKGLLASIVVLGMVVVVANVVFGVPVPGADTVADGNDGTPSTDSDRPTAGSESDGESGTSSSGDGTDSSRAGADTETDGPVTDPREVTYSVSYSAAMHRNYTPVLRRTFEFWEGEDRNTEELDFVFTADSTDSDIHVDFTGLIETCRGDRSGGTFYFCSVETDTDQSRVQVAGVYEQADMEQLLRNLVGQYAGHESPERFDGVSDLSTTRLEFVDPWPTMETVTANLSVEGGADRNWETLVGEGVDFWQANQDQYANYTQDIVFDPGARSADITVSIVAEISVCGIHDDPGVDPLGCAERYNRSLLADDTVNVKIEAGWDNRTTVQTVKHEFGHVYGRVHGQEPMPIMNASYADARAVPEPNASERANPFGSDPIRVYVATDTFSAPRDAVTEQVQHAVDYYDEGTAETVPSELEVTLYDDRETADIVVQAGSISQCRGESGAGSCGDTYGNNTDSDPAWEYYNRQDISLKDIDVEAIGWHVGYWMGFTLTDAEEQAELPPPFRESDYEHVRNWWK